MAFVTVSGSSMNDAMQSSSADNWKKAMDSEYKQLINKNVFDEVDDLSEGKKAVESKIVQNERLIEQVYPVFFLCADDLNLIPGNSGF